MYSIFVAFLPYFAYSNWQRCVIIWRSTLKKYIIFLEKLFDKVMCNFKTTIALYCWYFRISTVNAFKTYSWGDARICGLCFSHSALNVTNQFILESPLANDVNSFTFAYISELIDSVGFAAHAWGAVVLSTFRIYIGYAVNQSNRLILNIWTISQRLTQPTRGKSCRWYLYPVRALHVYTPIQSFITISCAFIVYTNLITKVTTALHVFSKEKSKY